MRQLNIKVTLCISLAVVMLILALVTKDVLNSKLLAVFSITTVSVIFRNQIILNKNSHD